MVQRWRPSWAIHPHCCKRPRVADLLALESLVPDFCESRAEDFPHWKQVILNMSARLQLFGYFKFLADTCCGRSWNWGWRGPTGQWSCPTRLRGGRQGSRAGSARLGPPPPWWQGPAWSSSWPWSCCPKCLHAPPPPVRKWGPLETRSSLVELEERV